jgi:hypothetical protein
MTTNQVDPKNGLYATQVKCILRQLKAFTQEQAERLATGDDTTVFASVVQAKLNYDEALEFCVQADTTFFHASDNYCCSRSIATGAARDAARELLNVAADLLLAASHAYDLAIADTVDETTEIGVTKTLAELELEMSLLGDVADAVDYLSYPTSAKARAAERTAFKNYYKARDAYDNAEYGDG